MSQEKCETQELCRKKMRYVEERYAVSRDYGIPC